mmetsp:Transcript_42614/g.74098  ORF Transcript_42614/g.74098 Transcript_42614/m.74098 type:complete len:171 (+) Transcript_42614:63-575(+)
MRRSFSNIFLQLSAVVVTNVAFASQPLNTRRLLVHRDGPKYSNPNGMCSTTFDAGPTATLIELKESIEKRLSFPVGQITLQSGEEVLTLDGLTDGVLLSVFERITTSETDTSLSSLGDGMTENHEHVRNTHSVDGYEVKDAQSEEFAHNRVEDSKGSNCVQQDEQLLAKS